MQKCGVCNPQSDGQVRASDIIDLEGSHPSVHMIRRSDPLFTLLLNQLDDANKKTRPPFTVIGAFSFFRALEIPSIFLSYCFHERK